MGMVSIKEGMCVYIWEDEHEKVNRLVSGKWEMNTFWFFQSNLFNLTALNYQTGFWILLFLIVLVGKESFIITDCDKNNFHK